ncbi:UNVERIFIED_CONTAM: hypothetical protein GTU68_028929, partial [Idotea baltica]|nr:hypothetical protein [Idotea baltica]
ISVSKLTKLYGTQKAVNSINFTANKGEIVGFLGPNGAGKSTTMKMITGYLPSSSGEIQVCGNTVTTDNLSIRQKIGYLPENNPLYLDMYVKEYLGFIAKVYSVKNPKSVINNLIEQTGLGVEQHKKIGQLSKGYRQRVGLAQAMMNNPEVLILDEPTSGLDPNQLVDIRALIKTLGKEKTVLLSTHIMQEVEAVCDRVIIINKGELVADDTTNNLQASAQQRVVYLVEFSNAITASKLKEEFELDNVEIFGNQLKITSSKPTDLRPLLFNYAVETNNPLLTLAKQQSNLEDVFRALTKKN